MSEDKLTPEQEKLLEEYRDKWLGIGLATGRVDRERCEKAAMRCYEINNKPLPKKIIWCDSPAEGAKEAAKLSKKSEQEELRRGGAGSFDASWLGAYDFYHNVLDIDCSHLEGLWELAHCGMWWPFEDVCILTERPRILSLNEQNRLHAEFGPAVAYFDDSRFYFWNGVRVPEKLIEHPEEVTSDDIMKNQNTEILRAYGEKLTWNRFIELIGGQTIDSWTDDKSPHKCTYELLIVKPGLLAGDPKFLKMLSPEVQDGTRPYYIEPVHPDLKTAKAARKWQFSTSDGRWPTPEECNENPDLSFMYES